MREHDAIIVGGGIAGASLAWALAERGARDVVIVEREPHPGMHATGRSAASLVEVDPIPTLSRLKAGGAEFLRHPPPGFAAAPLLATTGILLYYRAAPEIVPGVRAVRLSAAEAVARVPVLAPRDGGLFLPDDGHIDVDALLAGYLRGAAATMRASSEVTGVVVDRGRARGVVTAAGETIAARWVVAAAGAWAAEVGRLAGAAPLALAPLRRSIATFAAPDGLDARGWPLVMSEAESVYFAPESGGLLMSPMDETPSPACDARADDTAIAAGLERLRALAPALAPRSLRRRWAGLRTFAPDRIPVVGEDPWVRGFFWLAGQGGCGIETSPLVARIAADLLLDGTTERFDAAALSPGRLDRA
jgi:D-arginine dehydrogenase